MRSLRLPTAAVLLLVLLGTSRRLLGEQPSPRAGKLYDGHDVTTGRLFFPRRTPPLRGAQIKNIDLALPGGETVRACWIQQRQHAPTLLYLYGNGETAADQLAHWPAWARRAGCNLMLVDYPGYGASPGAPTLTGCSQSAQAALDHLLRQPAADVPAVVVMGRSLGSVFALDAAASCRDRRLCGLVLESGIADLARRLEPRLAGVQPERAKAILDQTRRDFDHREKMSRVTCPVLVLHTRRDTIVPAWNGQQLAGWAGARGQLVLFEQGDHNTIQTLNAESYQRALGEFIRKVTPAAAAHYSGARSR
jgi:pimeloyl-ACP methyl ester carboxylesterase